MIDLSWFSIVFYVAGIAITAIVFLRRGLPFLAASVPPGKQPTLLLSLFFVGLLGLSLLWPLVLLALFISRVTDEP